MGFSKHVQVAVCVFPDVEGVFPLSVGALEDMDGFGVVVLALAGHVGERAQAVVAEAGIEAEVIEGDELPVVRQETDAAALDLHVEAGGHPGADGF